MKTRSHQLLPYFVFCSLFAFLTLRCLIIFSAGTDIAGIEQNVIYSMQVFMSKGNLYFPPSEAPFSITQYTPLYYYLGSFTAKLTGYDAKDIHALYVIGRSWNLIFNLITALIVFKIGRSILLLSKQKSYLLFLLSFVFSFSHNFAVRPDTLQDLTGIASIYTFLLFQKKTEAGKGATFLLFISVFLTALSVFSKQSGIQFIIIFGGYFFLNREWKNLFKTIFFSAIIYGGFLLLFRFLDHSFFKNVIGGVANGINIENFVKYILIKNIFVLTVWPLIFFVIYLILKNNSIFRGSSQERFLYLCTLGTLVFASVTALKMGSTVQYYTLFINLSLLMILSHLQKEQTSRPALEVQHFNLKEKIIYLFFILVPVLYGVQNLKLILNYDHNPKLEAQRSAALKTADYIEKNRIKNSGRYIFSNLTTDSSIPSRQSINNVLYEVCLVPQMDILEYSTGPSKILGYKNLESMLQNGEVEYIIESNPKSRFVILNNLENIKNTKFKLVKEIEGYLIYKFSENP